MKRIIGVNVDECSSDGEARDLSLFAMCNFFQFFCRLKEWYNKKHEQVMVILRSAFLILLVIFIGPLLFIFSK